MMPTLEMFVLERWGFLLQVALLFFIIAVFVRAIQRRHFP